MGPVTNGFWKTKNKKPTREISLLSKTLGLFTCRTAVCFVFTVPLFYLLTKYFCITISDESIDEKPLDVDTLFCRLHSGNIRQKDNGLGLAIVRAICNLLHWFVEYKFEAYRLLS